MVCLLKQIQHTFTRFGAGVMVRSIGAAPDVLCAPSDVRKILSFLNARRQKHVPQAHTIGNHSFGDQKFSSLLRSLLELLPRRLLVFIVLVLFFRFFLFLQHVHL